MRRTTVIILCWNRWDLTERCLATLKASTDLSDVDVLVVDNGSTDETPARLKEYGWLKVVRNERNLGYVRGNNAGIAAADPASDVLLLNNDMEIHQPDWIARLRETAHASPDVGIVGCRLVFPDGRLLHAGTYILPDTFWGQQIGGLEADVNQYARTRDVQGIVFACAYIRREVVAAIGSLSEDYESYFEDTDYCLRARDAGFRTVCCGAVTLVHVQHGSTSQTPGLFEKMFHTSQARFKKTWKPTLEGHYTASLHWQSILNFPTGYATTGRGILRELDARGVRMSYEYVYGPGTSNPHTEPENTGDYLLNVISGRRPGLRPPVSVVYAVGEEFARNRGRYKVGYTMLEVDGFPDDWVRQANLMDEVWVPSSANRDAFVRSGVTKPVLVMPLGVDIDHFNPSIRGWPNPHGLYVFLAVFEWGERKAPGLLLSAFNRAFRCNEPAVLVCKMINKNRNLDVRREIEALRLSSGGGRIVFLHNREIPVPRARVPLPLRRLLRLPGPRRGLGHAAHRGDGLRPARDRDGLGRAHGVRRRGRTRTRSARAGPSRRRRSARTTTASRGPTPTRTISGSSSATSTRTGRRRGRRAAARRPTSRRAGRSLTRRSGSRTASR